MSATFTALHVVSSARWLADDFAAASPSLRVVHDLGLDLGSDANTTAWWCPMRFAGRLLASEMDPGFVAPGPQFTARLDRAHLGRHVVAAQMRDALLHGERWADRPVHAKLAESKRDGVPAQVYPNLASFLDVAAEAGIPDGSWAQLSDPVEMVTEARCYILDGKPVTGSVYLHYGQTWDAWDRSPDVAWAMRKAAEVASGLAAQPRAYTLDLARLADGAVVVIEANPAWSSAPYHSDMRQVTECILASQGTPGDEWAWNPDPSILTLRYPLQQRR